MAKTSYTVGLLEQHAARREHRNARSCECAEVAGSEYAQRQGHKVGEERDMCMDACLAFEWREGGGGHGDD